MRKILKKKSKNAEKATEGQENGNKKTNKATKEDSADDTSEEQFEVEKIIDSKIENDVCFYLIRWKGYSSEDDTWEAEDQIDASEAIAAFKKRNDKIDKKTSSKKKDDDASDSGNQMDAPETIKKSNGKTQKKATPKKKEAVKSKKRDAASNNEKEEEEWEVEKVVDMVDDDEETGERLFRIRWKGFSAKNDTWEPESNLSCADLIKKYLSNEKRAAKKDLEPKDLRDNRKTTERYEPNNFTGRASRRHGKLRKVYYDAE